MEKWDLNFKTYCKFVAEELMDFEEGMEWDVEDWNESYEDLKTWMGGTSLNYLNSREDKEIVTEFVKEFYQDASPATHSYWLKDKNGLDRVITSEVHRHHDRPALGIAIQDKQYHGHWNHE